MFFKKKEKSDNVLHIVENKDLLKRYFMLIIGLLIYSIAII